MNNLITTLKRKLGLKGDNITVIVNGVNYTHVKGSGFFTAKDGIPIKVNDNDLQEDVIRAFEAKVDEGNAMSEADAKLHNANIEQLKEQFPKAELITYWPQGRSGTDGKTLQPWKVRSSKEEEKVGT